MKLEAIIEKAKDGGISIHSPQVKGVYAAAPTEEEAKAEFVEMLDEMAEDILDNTGALPQWKRPGGYDIDYTYTLSGFFEAFPFINASELALTIGVNPSLMRRYKSGQSSVSKRQKEFIQTQFNHVVERMQAVKF